MALLFPGFPALPAHRMRVAIDGRTFDLRFTYRDRTESWYLDVWRVDDGTAVALGRRLTPGWDPLLGLALDDGPEADGGFLTVRGTDPYLREALGGDLRLVFMGAAEIAEGVTSTDDGLTVAIS